MSSDVPHYCLVINFPTLFSVAFIYLPIPFPVINQALSFISITLSAPCANQAQDVKMQSFVIDLKRLRLHMDTSSPDILADIPTEDW